MNIEEVKSTVDLPSLIGEYAKPSRSKKFFCPFHNEKTASLQVTQRKGVWLWKCFGCHKGGDVFKFVMEIEKISFKESVDFLANRLNVSVNSKSSLVQLSKRRLYKEQIGLLIECLDAEKSRLQRRWLDLPKDRTKWFACDYTFFYYHQERCEELDQTVRNLKDSIYG